MGVRIVVLDPTAGCPASSVAVQIVGSFRDSGAVKQIAQLVSCCLCTPKLWQNFAPKLLRVAASQHDHLGMDRHQAPC